MDITHIDICIQQIAVQKIGYLSIITGLKIF